MVLNLKIFILVSIPGLSIAPYLRELAANTDDVYHQQLVRTPVFSPLHWLLVTPLLSFFWSSLKSLFSETIGKMSIIPNRISRQCTEMYVFNLFLTLHYYLDTGSPLLLSLVSAQLTCGSVTRRAAPGTLVTWPAPALGCWSDCLTQTWPGRFTSEPVTSGDRPGPALDLGEGAVSAPAESGCWLHSRQCPSQELPAQSQGRPEFAWQTWNQFEPRGVILALLGSPLATSGAMAGPS